MIDAHSPTGAPTGAPTAGWATGPLGAVQAANLEIGRQTALRARAVAGFAATRPASADRPAGAPGAMSAGRRASRPEVLADVSEWAPQEMVVALSITHAAAANLLERSLTLVHRLPRTLLALESGLIHDGHVWHLLDKVGPIADATIRARVERDVLDWVAGRSVTTPPQLAGKVRRSVLRHDVAAAAQRLVRALRERGVVTRPDRREGMAVVEALLTIPETEALMDALGRYADALDDPHDGRSRGQKMADCLLDLVLRPGRHDHAPVQAQLTVVAGIPALLGGDQPGEVAGQVVPAEMVRALARAFGLLPGQEDAPGDAAPGEVPAIGDAPATEAHADGDGDGPTAVDRAAPRGEPVDGDRYAADGSPEAEALESWWAAVEERALRGEWRGADAPPLEVLERWWAEEERWSEPAEPEPRPPGAAGDTTAPACGTSPPTGPSTSTGSAGPPTGPPASADSAGQRATATSTATSTAGAAAAAAAAEADAGEAPPRSTGTAWSDADRAVERAGTALLDLQRATGRAVRAVDAAARAEAADENDRQESGRGRISRARGALDALREATAEQRDALAALLDRGAGGGLVDRPRIAVVDELTGALLALTDSDELLRHATCGARRCRRDPARCDHDLSGRPGLGSPGPSGGYRPGAALDRFVRARDRRCRFPGCRRRVPRGGELDHDRPWPDGPTAAPNLVGYCTGHHRGKHQAPGWRHELAPDGTLTVTTPTGLVASTTPPPF